MSSTNIKSQDGDAETFQECKICPVCEVRILESNRGVAGELENPVLFSHGKPGTKARLWARVCQHIQRNPEKYPRCLNKNFIHDPDAVPFLQTDFYSAP